MKSSHVKFVMLLKNHDKYLSAGHKSNGGAPSDLNCNNTSKLNNKMINTLKAVISTRFGCMYKYNLSVLICGSINEFKIL